MQHQLELADDLHRRVGTRKLGNDLDIGQARQRGDVGCECSEPIGITRGDIPRVAWESSEH